MNTEMQLFNIYPLTTGGTVFVGKPKHELPGIIITRHYYMATLIVDGSIYQEDIKIMGSSVPETAPQGQRTLGTRDKVDLDIEFVKSHDCRLILIDRLTTEVLTEEEYRELISITLNELKTTN
jgi:hypothetical protein